MEQYTLVVKQDDSAFVLALCGRVDTTNAEDMSARFFELSAGKDGVPVVIDAEELRYISSAGLRSILKMRKAFPSLRIINASADVYDIFEMTGFTEMIPIEKAYRRISVEGCEVIGEGANGKVYRTDPETIVKVYRDPDSLDDIKHEREVARRAFILGVPTAISYDVVKVGDSYASVFELLNAELMSKCIAREPEKIDEYIRLYVGLLKTLHSTEVNEGELPSHKETGMKWVAELKGLVPDEQYEKVYALMDAIPENRHMVHGDYHVKNVMVQNGEALLIDMDTLSAGDPVFEFAAIYLGYSGFSELDHSQVEKFLGITWEQAQHIWRETLRLYLGTDDESVLQAAEDKARLACYIRLVRRTVQKDPGNTVFIEHCKKRLAEYLEKVDSLAF